MFDGMFNTIFGTKKAVDDILDKENGIIVRVGGFLNDLHLSDAERAKLDIERQKLAVQLLAALKPFKVVQRIIAFATMFLWGFLGVNIVFAIWIEALINKTITTIEEGVTTIVVNNYDIVGPLLELAQSQYVIVPTGLVLSLYMAGGSLESRNRMTPKP